MEWGLLGGVPEVDRQRVLATARRRRFGRGEVIFNEGDRGDTLHLIAKGKVAIRTSTPLGDTATLTVLGVGEFFGEQALLGADTRRTATAVALDTSETLSVLRDGFEEMRRAHPSVERFLVEVLSEQLRRTTAHLLEALYLPVETRLFHRLRALAELYRSGSGPVSIPLTQDDLASMAGTTRSTANRILRQAEVAGSVVLTRGRIVIVDLDTMAESR